MKPPLARPGVDWTRSTMRLAERLSPRQRQYLLLAAILAAGLGLLWLVFASADQGAPNAAGHTARQAPGKVTHIGVMPPGQQVDVLDQWVGTAGSKLAQYETEREEQARLNRDRQTFETRTMQRFAELEQRLTAAAQATKAPATGSAVAAMPPAMVPAPPPPAPTVAPGPPAAAATTGSGMPPAAALPQPTRAGHADRPGTADMPSGLPLLAAGEPGAAIPTISRVKVTGPTDNTGPRRAVRGPEGAGTAAHRTVSTWLPVSFVRGTLLGGLDAPTGGQAQSNPHPVLIRLSDNAVLPNRFRGQYRECFVIAAGYGDISSERAYLRTENLSCVRADGATLEVRIQGSVYGEDGKVGMRGRLVTKQGQMLANALLAGVVGGIGQGLATSSTNVSTSALGTIASASGADAYKAGLGTGVGRALDRLAQYYIRLAENTFPVIEVDAGREIDVVITKGVRIDVPMDDHGREQATAVAAPRPADQGTRHPSSQEVSDDAEY